MLHPPGRLTESFRNRRWLRSRVVLACFLVFVLLLVAVRVALPYVLRELINRRLNAIPDYGGQVAEVGVSLYRGAYQLQGMQIVKRNGAVKEPFFLARNIDFSLAWRELVHGKVVSDIYLDHAVLNFVKGPTDESSQLAVDRRWQDVINDIFPISITFLKITDGQLRYVDATSKPLVDVRVAHLLAVATGLRNRPAEKGEEFPAALDLLGETIGGGNLHIAAQAEPLALKPHFLLKFELDEVSLPALNEFLRAYGGIDVSGGTFKGYLEMIARDGHFSGYFKPFFQHVNFSPKPGEERPLGQKIWETLVRTFALIFKNHHKDQVATRMPFSGEFGSMNVGIWQTFVNLLRNAFIQALPEKLDSKPAPAAVPVAPQKPEAPAAPKAPAKS